jgi:16S rRNA C1402 N4-methylase RsmH
MHYPVMLNNVIKKISSMNMLRKFAVVDCNFGLGGHSNAILKTFSNSLMYEYHNWTRTAYDLDQTMIDKYKTNPQLHVGDQTRLTIINHNFTNVLQ